MFKHGHARRGQKTRTYEIWKGMHKRCKDPSSEFYYLYGGRGIKIHPRWSSFKEFLEDMGECPRGMSIDRVDTNGDYSKSNCRWATAKEQNRNSRHNKHIVYLGKSMCFSEWEEELGYPNGLIKSRISRGWSELEAVSVKPKEWRTITYNGSTRTIKEWAIELGYSVATLKGRLDREWEIDRMMMQKAQIKKCR